MSELQYTDAPDEGALSYTQRIRRRLIAEMTAETLPSDNKDRLTLLHALKDMDAQELGKMKIDAKEKSSSADRAAAEILGHLLTGPLRDVNPYQAAADAPPPPKRVMPNLDISDLQLVRGETSIGLSTDNLASMASRTGMRLDSIPGAGRSEVNLEFAPKDPTSSNEE